MSCIWTGYKYDAGKRECGASFASFMYDIPNWNRKFITCPECGVKCLPYMTRWLDPTYLRWKVEKWWRFTVVNWWEDRHYR